MDGHLPDLETAIRGAAFQFLDEVTRDRGGLLRYEDVARFQFQGVRVPLLDPQRGIRKPRDLAAALSVRTVFAADPASRPYEDQLGYDGLLRYKWRGEDPQHPDNRALRVAMKRQLPMIWFTGVAPGTYVAHYPVWMIAEEPTLQQFVVAIDQVQVDTEVSQFGGVSELTRRYRERLVRDRVHQPVFRASVLLEYAKQCALCRLKHIELLDAAHIVPDSLGGRPIVTNGVAMCKIHHAAFDHNIIGLRPDHVIQVRADVLEEVDGPTLRHALQGMHGERMALPARRAARPGPEFLEQRYEEFLRAG